MVNNNDFASGLLSGFMNTYVPIAKMGLEREQAAQLAAYRQAQLDQMKFEQGRQQKSDWQNDYDKGMKQIANNYLAGVLTGKNPSLPDSSVLGYMDPSVLAAIQQKDQDRAMTAAFMKALGGDIAPGTQPSTYASPRASQGPSGQQPSSGFGDGPIWQRQNNPGNLRVPGQTSFQAFPTMQDGLNAYYDQIDRYGQRGLNTIRKIVSTYAPPNENNTNGYIALVSKATGLGPDDPIDFANPDQKIALGKAMTSVEGSGKALTDDMHRRAVGLLPPGSEDQRILDIATNGNPVQLAQAGQQTMTDASGAPLSPKQAQPSYRGRVNDLMKLPPDQFARVLIAAPKEYRETLTGMYKMANPEAPGALREFQAFSQMSPEDQVRFAEYKRLSKPETNVNIDGGKKFQQTLGELWAKDYQKMFDDASNAQDVRNNIQAARQVLAGGLQTGALEPAKAGVAAVAQSFGIDPQKLGLPNASDAQKFNSVVMKNLLAELVMQKGPQTEGDASRALKTFAQLGNTPEANQFAMDYADAVAQRKQEMADYIYNVGKKQYDGDSFKGRQDWQKRINGTPLFAVSPQTGKPVTYYQFRDNAQANGLPADEIDKAWQQFAGKK